MDISKYCFVDCKNISDEPEEPQNGELNESESLTDSCDHESSIGIDEMHFNQETLDHSYLSVISNRDGGDDHLVHDITTEEVIQPEVHSIFNSACIIPIDVLL